MADANERQYVYVVRAYESGHIKIGTSHDPFKRLASLQTSNHEQLELLCVVPGDRALEHRLHTELAHDRLRGEWFRCSDHAVMVIGRLAGWGDDGPPKTAQQSQSELKAKASSAAYYAMRAARDD